MHESSIIKNIPNDVKSIEIVIIVVTYNCRKFIKCLINSLIAQTYDLRKVLFLVIDNASKDKTFEEISDMLTKLSNKLNYIAIRLRKNYGFALANNLGLKLLKTILGEFREKTFILLNPDTRIIKRTFLEISRKLSSIRGIIGIATISGKFDTIDSLGAYIDYLGNPQDILCGVKITPSVRELISYLPKLYTIPSVCFAAVIIRGEVLERMGFLRNSYIIYFEDTEFCLRAWSKGIPVILYRDFMVWHMRGGTQIHLRLKERRVQNEREGDIDISHHFAKNALLLSFEYLGMHIFAIKVLMYILTSIIFRKKYLVHSIFHAINIIIKERIKPKRLPKGIVLLNPKTWVLFWTLKYYLQYNKDIEKAINYGAKKASSEYLIERFLKIKNKHLVKCTC